MIKKINLAMMEVLVMEMLTLLEIMVMKMVVVVIARY